MQASSTTFVQQSQAAVQVILGSQAVYRGLRRFTDAVWATTVFVCLGLPAIAAFWLLLFLIRRRLSASLRQTVQINFSNYAQLRREFDALEKNRQQLQNQQQLNLKNLPWWLRGVVSQIKKIDALNNLRLQAIETELHKLNPKHTPACDRLHPLSEAELWERRTKAYDYLM